MKRSAVSIRASLNRPHAGAGHQGNGIAATLQGHGAVAAAELHGVLKCAVVFRIDEGEAGIGVYAS